MVDQSSTSRIARTQAERLSVTVGALAVHVIATAAGAGLLLLDRQNCDRGDVLVGAAAIALMIDIILGIAWLAVSIWRLGMRRRTVLKWSLAVAPYWLLAIVLVIAANSLGSGCPV